jgi:putative redox protein
MSGDDTIAFREVHMSGQRFGEVVELTWQGGLRFEARAGDQTLTVDSQRQGGISPTQALAISLAGCMAIDVVDVLQKGRFAPEAVEARLETERRPEPPRYVTRATIHFVVRGEVPADRVERAIELSRERYCSVWHSLRPDIDFRTSFEIAPSAARGDGVTGG